MILKCSHDFLSMIFGFLNKFRILIFFFSKQKSFFSKSKKILKKYEKKIFAIFLKIFEKMKFQKTNRISKFSNFKNVGIPNFENFQIKKNENSKFRYFEIFKISKILIFQKMFSPKWYYSDAISPRNPKIVLRTLYDEYRDTKSHLR